MTWRRFSRFTGAKCICSTPGLERARCPPRWSGGSSQAICRGIYARIVPVEKQAEFFGFNAMAGRAATLLGPLVFGWVSSSTGSQRIGLISLLVFFIAGGVVISMCRLDNEPRKQA